MARSGRWCPWLRGRMPTGGRPPSAGELCFAGALKPSIGDHISGYSGSKRAVRNLKVRQFSSTYLVIDAAWNMNVEFQSCGDLGAIQSRQMVENLGGNASRLTDQPVRAKLVAAVKAAKRAA